MDVLRFTKEALIGGLAFTVICAFCPLGMSAFADQPIQDAWTTQDLDATVNGAEIAVSKVTDRNVQASLLLDLVEALASAGALPRAHSPLQKAALAASASDETVSSTTREKVIQKLAQFDEFQSAEALIDAVVSLKSKATLLGKLGVERARVGDLPGAVKAAAGIQSLLITNTASSISDNSAGAISEIGRALAVAGFPDEALHLASSLPDSGFRQGIVMDAVFKLCDAKEGRGTDFAKGRELVKQMLEKPAKTNGSATKFRQLSGIEALAKCEGPEAALFLVRKSFPPDEVDGLFKRISVDLFSRNESDLAWSFTPPVDPENAASLLDGAMRLTKQGDDEAARKLAIEASRIALKETRDVIPKSQWYDHLALLGRIFDTLNRLHAYDQAIATIQPNDALNRPQYYVDVVKSAIAANDATTIPRLASAAIEAMTVSVYSEYPLRQLIHDLARAGYRDAAGAALEKLKHLYDDPTTPGAPRLPNIDIAEAQAVMGDLQTALDTAERVGPLTVKPGPLPYVLAAGMGADNESNSVLAVAKILWRAVSLRISHPLPPLGAGPKAAALLRIATALAEEGNIDGAFKAEAGLEVEPRDVLQGARDAALSSIALAQAKSGKLRASLTTALRIADPAVQVKSILPLAAIPQPQ